MRRLMMTTPDLTTTAYAKLAHAWELNGSSVNPKATIRRIASDVAPTQGTLRNELEDTLFEQWALLCAEGGDEL